MAKTNRDRIRNRHGDTIEQEEEFIDRSPARKQKKKHRRREIDKNLKSLVREGLYNEEGDDEMYDNLMEDY